MLDILEDYRLSIYKLCNDYFKKNSNRLIKIGYEYDDILQILYIESIKALKSYNKERGSNKNTFIIFCCKNRLKTLSEHIHNKKNTVKFEETKFFEDQYANETETISKEYVLESIDKIFNSGIFTEKEIEAIKRKYLGYEYEKNKKGHSLQTNDGIICNRCFNNFQNMINKKYGIESNYLI